MLKNEKKVVNNTPGRSLLVLTNINTNINTNISDKYKYKYKFIMPSSPVCGPLRSFFATFLPNQQFSKSLIGLKMWTGLNAIEKAKFANVDEADQKSNSLTLTVCLMPIYDAK